MSATPSSADPFRSVRSEIAQRSVELVSFWSEIKAWEVPPPAPQSFRFRAGKGFVLVYVYGLLEFSTNKLVSQLTQLITDKNVRGKDYSSSIRVLAHEPKIQSIIGISEKKGLRQRLALYHEIDQTDHCGVSEAVLGKQLQNVWAVSIENIFAIFGLDADPFFDGKFGKRADALVGDRNAVAHGRETPEIIGEKYSTTEIEELISDTSNQISYMENCMKNYLDAKLFVDSRWRHRY